MLSGYISRKCNMVYRRSISFVPERRQSRLFELPTLEDGAVHEMPDFTPEPGPRSLKRHRPHDDEEEMALFRCVRIKTEIEAPTTNIGVNGPLSECGNPIPQSCPNPKIGPTAEADKKKPIKFLDAVRREFSFPFELCCTWAVSTNSFVWMHY
jgi:hypothetical protein